MKNQNIIILFLSIFALFLLILLVLVSNIKPSIQIIKENNNQEQNVNSKVSSERDYRVLYDQLHPPLNRTTSDIHDSIIKKINTRDLYIPTKIHEDRYRQIGYLINKDEKEDKGGNTWKLFGLEKDRNNSEFYIIPSNRNYDIKINLSNDIVVGNKLRSVYDIPNELKFNSPLLNETPYEFVELPKTDFTQPIY